MMDFINILLSSEQAQNYFARSLVYFVIHAALVVLGIIVRAGCPERWKGSYAMRPWTITRFAKALLSRVAISLVPFVRFIFAILYVFVIFTPDADSLAFKEWALKQKNKTGKNKGNGGGFNE